MPGHREAPAASRPIDVLLMIVGAVDGAPLRMGNVAEAFDLGVITIAEAKLLQRWSRLSPRGRKALAMQGRNQSEEARAKHAAKSADLAARLNALGEALRARRSGEGAGQ